MDTLASLARDLVSIPSHDDEATAGEFIEQWLESNADARVARDDHGNVIARKGRGDDSLAFVGHHDVVPPDGSQVNADGEYVVEEREGRLYGRGTADMKGCVAAAMLAFRDADPAGELVFASFVGEEQGGVGCQAAIEDGFAPDYAVVGEGSTGYSAAGVTDVAVAHKGRRGSTIVAEGAAAHASEPGAGANAIYRATDAVDVVRDLDFPETTVLGHEMSGSVAVTEIDGGSAWNVIPERCEVTVDERTVPGERAPLDRAEAIDGVSWRVDQDLPPMACGDADFAAAVLDAATAAQDSAPEHVVKPHATDAGWLAQAGTDCVVVGAAEPGEAHTADESVSLAVLERCREVYERVAEAWPSK
ncbi:M20 family peptidase [Haloarcula sp. CBA1130]|uniref:M20 family metallopeptidase n=1 Tax=unclassified Haloarcula TaxID=2624677 RepID=UPI001247F870|nr:MULTISPECIES: M20/M25/M40 family metallo-hydrolase [unclassified Haloarcula]KAA9399908.1 M20 family peptidase [Haloarcula sp. CBA1129]KAA9401602.1 M20 family peptidase [Haloarcula sp. CBA1130]